MRPDVLPADQALGLRQAFGRPGLTVLPVCAPGRDASSQAWIVNLAAALAERGRRTVILDAGPGLVSPALGLKARRELRHLLAGECTFDETVLEAGGGLAVLPAPRGLEMFLASGEAPATLFGAFLALPEPPAILLANGPVELVAPLVEAGEEIVFVASPARESVTGVYAAIKRLEQSLPGRVSRIALTGVADADSGDALARRLADATSRFLGHNPAFAPAVPDDVALHEAARAGRTVLAARPDGPAAEAFRRLADGFDGWRAARHDTPLEG